MTQRFDRTAKGGRLHMISLCALAHLDYNLIATHSYDQYLQAAQALGLGPDEIAQAFRRMVFNVMAVNHDDHTKNFAFLQAPDGAWRLAPAFDITHSYHPESKWTSRHLMAVNGKFEHIATKDFYTVGERNDVPGYRQIVRDVRHAVEDWPSFAGLAEIRAEVADQVATDIENVMSAG
jgi:serine/threonine-protein kinase HipA